MHDNPRKTLLLVESPTKARTIRRLLRELGFRATVRATLGHLRDLPTNELGVDIQHGFRPHYVVPPHRQRTVAELRPYVQQAQRIILAMDPDREGEAVAWHVLKVFAGEIAGKEVQRIVFHEITASALAKALRNPRSVDTHLVKAAVARRVIDRLIGYKISLFLWKRFRKQRNLGAGRVQMAALRLLVEAEAQHTPSLEVDL